MKTIILFIAILFSFQVVYAEQLIIRSKDADGKEEVIVHEYTPVPDRPREKKAPRKTPEKKAPDETKDENATQSPTGVYYPYPYYPKRRPVRPVHPIAPPRPPIRPPVAVPLPSN